MAPDRATGGICDVLYRDPHRIPSLSAQLFGGVLASMETVTTARKVNEAGGGGEANFSVLKLQGQVKRTSDDAESLRESRQPHDEQALRVVTALHERELVNGDYKLAVNGGGIRVQGTLFFFDPNLFKLASIVVPEKKQKGEELSPKKLKELLQKLVIPPIFYLVDGATAVVGTVHEEGLSEPINAFHIKHGGDGLPDVTLIGVKETRSPLTPVLPEMMALLGKATRGISDMLVPPTAIRVSPLCLFRVLAE